MSINVIRLTTTAAYRGWLKSEYLFRTCSIGTDLVTSLQFHSNLCYYDVAFLANYGTIPCSLIFTPIAVLLQAVLQMNTEPFRNGPVKTRNRTIRTSRKPSTCPKWSEMMAKYVFWACNMNFCNNLCNQTKYYCYFPKIGNVWFFVYIILYCVGAGISTLMSISDGLGCYFCVERWKRRSVWGKKRMERCFPARVGIFCLRS